MIEIGFVKGLISCEYWILFFLQDRSHIGNALDTQN